MVEAGLVDAGWRLDGGEAPRAVAGSSWKGPPVLPETDTVHIVDDHPAAAARMARRQRLVLAVLLTASFTLAVDFSILNVALPSIGGDVGLSLDHLQWVATGFALCAAGFTLFFGRIADLFGRRRMFIAGMALLGASSLAGGLAQEPVLLISARVAQGLATAMVTPAALSLLTTSFPEGPQRARALGLNGSLMAAGFTTGAILGGVLTDLLSWRWAFFINVVIAAAVLTVAPVVLAESRPAVRPSLDVPGAVTVTTGLLAIVYGLTSAGQYSWSAPQAWLPLVVGVGLLAAFGAIESRVAQPLVRVAILTRRSVAWGNVAGLLAFATETSLVFLLTLYLQKVLGYSPLAAGLSFAVLGAGTVLGGLAGPRLVGPARSEEHDRRRAARPGRRDPSARPARHHLGLDRPAARHDVHRRDRQPRRDRRLHGCRDVGTARRRAGSGHRPRDDEPAGRHHDGHPDHVGDRYRPHPLGRRPDRRGRPVRGADGDHRERRALRRVRAGDRAVSSRPAAGSLGDVIGLR